MANETKITYATLSADDDEMHRSSTRPSEGESGAGPDHPALHRRPGTRHRDTTASTSPADTRVVVARVAAGTAQDVHDAVAAAKAAFPAVARARPGTKRAEILGRAADLRPRAPVSSCRPG